MNAFVPLRRIVLALCLTLAAAGVRAETFVLKNGGRIEGEIVNPKQSPRENYVIKTASGGQVTLAKSQVKEIVRQTDAEAEYEKMRPQFADTVEGQFAAAVWCREHGLARLRDKHLERVIELDPSHVAARLSLSRVQASLGHIDAAVKGYREVVRRDPGNAEGWFGLSNLNTVRFDAADAARMQHALARPGLVGREYELLAFSYAKALENDGEYAQAYEVFARANASRRQRVKWDATGERRRVTAILDAFAKDLPLPLDPQLGREAILIVSIPRSGSTLVEQILASHPEVEGANEIKDMTQVIDAETHRRNSAFPLWVPDATPEDWQRLGREYLARTARWREHKRRFTDKSLVTWYLVGAALAMMPAARVLIVRRDPVETCLGCFRQCFSENSGFACNMDELADYCVDFLRLTRFWLDKYPDRVMDLQYESLVANPEAEVRRLLGFCDLPFDPACIEFHKTARTVQSLPSAAQVRQPIRRDTARSALYGDKLDRLRQRLRDAGVLVR